VKTNLKIRETQAHGRYCVATRKLTKKSEIITGTPYSFALTRMASRRTCAWSLESYESPLQEGCPLCKEVWYEDRFSRIMGYRWHVLECSTFQQIQKTNYNSSYKLLFKTIARAVIYKALEAGLSPQNAGVKIPKSQLSWLEKTDQPEWLKHTLKWKDYEGLVSNREALNKRQFGERLKMAGKLMQMLPATVVEYAFKGIQDPVDYLAECICRYECNCFGYFNPKTGDQIGSAVIPEISFINHSCSPNAKTVYYQNGGAITVEATEDILRGAEVNISYCDESKGRKTRQEYLFKYYHFRCQCPKCQKQNPQKS
jgi:hypothetical protein